MNYAAPEWKRSCDIPMDSKMLLSFSSQTQLPSIARKSNIEAIYHYQRNESTTAFVILRAIGKDGKKTFLPLTLWSSPEGKLFWAAKGMPASRPMYRGERLDPNKDRLVIISEGEKCADSVSNWRNFDSVSWCGGSNGIAATDFSPLEGRKVIILPDNDEPGFKAAAKLTEMLTPLCSDVIIIDICEVAKSMGETAFEGYDIADAVTAGLTEQLFIDHAKSLRPSTSTQQPVSPHPAEETVLEDEDYFETDEGIFQRVSRKGQEDSIFLCSPIKLTGRTDERSGGWGFLIAVKTPDGSWRNLNIRAAALAGDGREMREALLESGAIVATDREGRQALNVFISTQCPTNIVKVVDRIGWNDRNNFVLPSGTISAAANVPTVQLAQTVSDSCFHSSGNLEDWKNLTALLEHNSRAAFLICASLSGALLYQLGMDGGGGVNLFAETSRGKTTTAIVAGSVWGGGGTSGMIAGWNMTTSGAEARAVNHCDTVLICDDISVSSPETLKEIIYLIANDRGKGRATKTGKAQDAAKWQASVISTSEKPLKAFLS